MVKKRWLSLIIITCLLLSGAVAYGYLLKYQSLYRQNIEQVTETSQFQLLFTAREFYQFDSQISSTIELLKQNRALMNFVSAKDTTARRQIEELWSTLTGYQSFYKQIRFVDTEGNEQIKVEFSYLDQLAVARADYNNIQDKPYFKFASTLKSGQIGAPDIGLEKALADSFDPYIPIQHIIYPYQLEGVRKGYLILSIDFWLSASVLDFSPQVEFRPRIVTLNGDYVVHPDPERLFGFDIPERKKYNLTVSNKMLWQQMQKEPEGVLELNGNLYIYKRVNLNTGRSFYTLIEFTEKQLRAQLHEELLSIIQITSLIILAILLAGVPVGYLVYLSQKRSLESKLALAALNGMSAVMICDHQYRMVKVNREFENITGFKEAHIRHGNLRKLLFDKQGRSRLYNIWDTVNKEQNWQGELRILGHSGKELITITRIQAIVDTDDNVTNYIISLVDITERKELEERLRYLSEKDELSQIWNRRKFEAELQAESLLVERYPDNHIGCLALLDIDHFKKVNDEMGHDAGDRVIRQIACLLQQTTRQTDFIARIGGEEFAIIMPYTQLNEADIVLNRIRTLVALDSLNPVTVSIGVTKLTSNATHSYKCADKALYHSKSQGRNLVSVYEQTVQQQINLSQK